jgi:hypothetical protein
MESDRSPLATTRRFHSPKTKKKYNIVVHVGNADAEDGGVRQEEAGAAKDVEKGYKENAVEVNVLADSPQKNNGEFLYYPSR